MTNRFCVAFLALFCTIALAGKNLLPNGDFSEKNTYNEGPKHWYGVLDPGCGIDPKEAPEPGVNAVRIAGGSRLEAAAKVKAGHIYNCSWWLKTKDFNWKTEAAFQVVWTKKGQYLYTKWKDQDVWNMKLRNIHGTHDWTRFELNGIKAPDDADGAVVRILQVFESSGECWYAKLSMEEAKQGEPFQNRIATVPPCIAKITLENGFDQNLWKDAGVINNYMTAVSGALNNHRSETRIMADDEAIWVLSRNYQDKMSEILKKDYKLGNGHCIELFFLPPGREYEYHAIVSVKAPLFTCREQVGDQSWPITLHPWDDNGIQYKIKLLEDSWMALVRVPFAGMGYKGRPGQDEKWGANFCRTLGDDLSGDSSWSYLKDERFQNAPCFGQLRFSATKVPQVCNVTFSQEGAVAEIRNGTDKSLELVAALVDHADNSCNVVEENTLKLAPGEKGVCEVKHLVKSADMRYLEIRLDGKLLGKYSALPSNEYLSFYVFDPEGVRTQDIYLAVDTPFFIAYSMKHNFPGKLPNDRYSIIDRSEKAFDLYMEVPSCLKIKGISFDGIDWMKKWLSKATKVANSQDGKVVTYKMEMPCILNWSPHGFLIFYECDGAENLDFTGSYYFTHDGIEMPRHELRFHTMKIGKVKKPFEYLVYEADLLTPQTLYNWLPNDTINSYLQFGLNRIEFLIEPLENKEFYSGNAPKSNEQIYDLLVQQAAKSPHKVYFCTMPTTANMQAWRMTGKDPDSWAKSIDGSQLLDYNNYNTLCPSYRGKLYNVWRDRLLGSSAFIKYKCTFLSTDMEIYSDKSWDKICFCDRCKAGFVKYCQEHGHENYANLDVQAVLKEGKSPDLRKVWGEYMNYQYVDAVFTTVNQVKDFVKGAKSTSPFEHFTLSDWTSPASVIGKYLDLYEISAYFTPDLNYKKYVDLFKKWAPYTNRFICSTTLGQTPECPDFFETEEQVKDMVLEAAAFGTRGILWFYFVFVEPRRMRSMVAGMNAVRPYEDIIANGKLVWENLVTSDNPQAQLTELLAGNERIIGLRAYDAKIDQKCTLTLTNVNSKLDVYEFETNRKLGTVTPENPSFTAMAPAGHCKLLYVGTDAQWQARNK